MPNQTLDSFYSLVNTRVKESRTEKKEFDFIVLGLGSMGSSTCYHLAQQGYSVLGIEKYDITHENGSHAGQSRLIRQAYFEHPDYVPLLQEAYIGWQSIEKASESQLFYKTGILYSGHADDFLISGSLKSAQEHHLQLEELSSADQVNRFPQFTLPSHYKTIFEPNAGFVTPERAILTYINEAIRLGATIRTRETMIKWKKSANSLVVQTDQGAYVADRLIITTGAWTGQILPEFQPKLKVTKQAIFWVNINNQEDYKMDKMPCWGINQEELPGLFYGFPLLDENDFGGSGGLKIGYHAPGQPADPDNVSASVRQSDRDTIVSFMDKFMPGTFKSFREAKNCLYTYSPDDNFIVDFHPEEQNILFATGFSGHGFKFIPVIGQALADLAITGKSALPIQFLGLNRFA